MSSEYVWACQHCGWPSNLNSQIQCKRCGMLSADYLKRKGLADKIAESQRKNGEIIHPTKFSSSEKTKSQNLSFQQRKRRSVIKAQQGVARSHTLMPIGLPMDVMEYYILSFLDWQSIYNLCILFEEVNYLLEGNEAFWGALFYRMRLSQTKKWQKAKKKQRAIVRDTTSTCQMKCFYCLDDGVTNEGDEEEMPAESSTLSSYNSQTDTKASQSTAGEVKAITPERKSVSPPPKSSTGPQPQQHQPQRPQPQRVSPQPKSEAQKNISPARHNVAPCTIHFSTHQQEANHLAKNAEKAHPKAKDVIHDLDDQSVFEALKGRNKKWAR